MKSSLSLAAIALLLLVGFHFKKEGAKTLFVPYYNTADCTPLWITEKSEVATQVPHQIKDFSFLDQTGATISKKSIEGKIHVADFFFTSCSSVCPAMSHQFKLLQDSLMSDRDVELLSYSVTPWIDSVGRLKEYAETMGAKSEKWHMLTGDKAKIYDLARTSYFAEGESGFSKDSSKFLHTEHFILVDKTLRIRGIYNGTLALECERLLADIRAIEKEG